MSYKDNKNFKKYCNKHKDINRVIRDLETFCTEESCEMEIFGSLTRNDYYYGKSDCDTVFITDNVEYICANFENYIQHNPRIKMKRKQLTQYGFNIEHVKCSGIIYKMKINNCKFDIMIVDRKDYQVYSDLITPNINCINCFIVSIIKYFYYKIPIIPLSLYIYLKGLLFKRRLYIVKTVNLVVK